MKFSLVRLVKEPIEVSFDKIYSQQIKELRREDVEDEYDLEYDLLDGIEYYLNRIGINDLLYEENEDVFSDIGKEYEKWLIKDNFDISDFK
jgi:hypothetical protein